MLYALNAPVTSPQRTSERLVLETACPMSYVALAKLHTVYGMQLLSSVKLATPLSTSETASALNSLRVGVAAAGLHPTPTSSYGRGESRGDGERPERRRLTGGASSSTSAGRLCPATAPPVKSCPRLLGSARGG